MFLPLGAFPVLTVSFPHGSISPATECGFIPRESIVSVGIGRNFSPKINIILLKYLKNPADRLLSEQTQSEVIMFEVKSGKIRVSDPCYDRDTWCAHEIPVLDGKWEAEAGFSDEGSWGNRVAFILAVHEDYKSKLWKYTPYSEIADAGVDSGQLGIFDAESYPEGATGEYDDKGSFYGKCCDVTLSKAKAGYVDTLGFVSSSGYGDGAYPVEVLKNEAGQVIAVLVTFIDEVEEEDED